MRSLPPHRLCVPKTLWHGFSQQGIGNLRLPCPEGSRTFQCTPPAGGWFKDKQDAVKNAIQDRRAAYRRFMEDQGFTYDSLPNPEGQAEWKPPSLSWVFRYPPSYHWRVLKITWSDYKESWGYSFRGQRMPTRDKDGAAQHSLVPLTKEQKEEDETNQTLREFVQSARDVWSELRRRRREKKETVEDIKESLVDLKTTLQEISDTASQWAEQKRQEESIPKIKEALQELKDELAGVSKTQAANPEEIEEIKQNIRELREVVGDIMGEVGKKKEMLEIKEAMIDFRAAVDDLSPEVKVAAQRMKQVAAEKVKLYNEVVTSFVEGYKDTLALHESNPGLDPAKDFFGDLDRMRSRPKGEEESKEKKGEEESKEKKGEEESREKVTPVKVQGESKEKAAPANTGKGESKENAAPANTGKGE